MSSFIGDLPATSLVFNPIPTPSKAEMEAIPENSHVVYLAWPDAPPEIVGLIWNEDTRDEFVGMYDAIPASDDEREVRAADVFVFYIPPFEGEDAVIRRVMGLPSDADPGMVSDTMGDYSHSDVAEMIRSAIRMARQ